MCKGSALHDWVSEVDDDREITYCAQCGKVDTTDLTPDDDYDDPMQDWGYWEGPETDSFRDWTGED